MNIIQPTIFVVRVFFVFFSCVSEQNDRYISQKERQKVKNLKKMIEKYKI